RQVLPGRDRRSHDQWWLSPVAQAGTGVHRAVTGAAGKFARLVGQRRNRLAAMDFPVVYRRRVRYSDADAQKIVFNANYSVYFDDTLTDYLDAAGLGGETMPE